jgi:lysophospholipase L1-like esterase
MSSTLPDRARGSRARRLVTVVAAACLAAPVVSGEAGTRARALHRVTAALDRVLLVGVGDSLTHGTMDATNDQVRSQNAYLQKVADKLGLVTNLRFRQPFYDINESRLQPWQIPTNLGIDGADVFSIEGLRYHKRAGTAADEPSNGFLAEKKFPFLLEDDYDKVLFPINLMAGQPVSAIDAAVWQLTRGAALARADKAVGILWIGNNDSSGAALGTDGTPERQPVPFDQIASELPRGLRLLMRFGERTGQVSFAPYTQASIESVLTDVADFEAQFNHTLDRLTTETAGSRADVQWLVVTLPYYSAVGYLVDSEDLEFYLRKFLPGYTVPASFKRVAPPDQPITNATQGDRVALLTFGFMISLAATGHSMADVNAVLEKNGQQNDGMVLSEAEQAFIMARIDGFNAVIQAAAASHGDNVHVVDVGGVLSSVLTGQTPLVIGGSPISRKWTRGQSFSLDGVHPGYLGQAFIANMLLEAMRNRFGWDVSTYDLAAMHAADPYADHDGDGWAVGPSQPGPGFGELLSVLTDPDDGDASVQAQIPPDIWDQIAGILIGQFRRNPAMAREADRLGVR